MDFSLLVDIAIAAIAVSSAIFLLTIVFGKKLSKRKSALLFFLLYYAGILLWVAVVDHQLEVRAYSYDLNGDFIFSGKERELPGYYEAYSAWENDTGRVFAPITGFILSLLLAGVYYLSLHLVAFIPRIFRRPSR